MYGLISEDYLMHHGVKGMKWGVRHDPERVGRKRRTFQDYKTRRYSSNNSVANKKHLNTKNIVKKGAIVAGVVLGVSAGIGIAYLAKSGKGSLLIKAGEKYLSGMKFAKSIQNKGTAKFYKGELKKDVKRILKKGRLAAGGSKLSPIKSIKSSKLLNNGKAFVDSKINKAGEIATKIKKPKISEPTISKPDIKYPENFNEYAKKVGINPLTNNSRELDFKTINRDLNLSEKIKDVQEQFDPAKINKLGFKDQVQWVKNLQDGNLMNCTKCSQAGVLRSLGYDVRAGKSQFGINPDTILKYWKGMEWDSVAGAKMSKVSDNANFVGSVLNRNSAGFDRAGEVSIISNKLNSMPNGSKGIFNVAGPNGGHSLMFEVNNGNAKIIDNQISREYSSVKEFFDKIPNHNPSSAHWARLDNCEPNFMYMMADDVIRKV